MVIGLSQGVLDRVTVCPTEDAARAAVKRFDRALGIRRDPDGYYEHDENDVWWREVRLTK